MRYFVLISFFIIFASMVFAGNSAAEEKAKKIEPFQVARIFSPTGDDYIDINQNIDVTDWTYSAQTDSAWLGANYSLFPVCMYDFTALLSQNPSELIVNDFFIDDTEVKILYGIDDLKSCPMPGSTIFSEYPNALAGEFLISGIICVVNTAIYDAMFKIYCTVLLWFYNILYAMIIIYVMFYGMSIMLGLGRDPLREAPIRIIKIIVIFILATNAQLGYRYLHKSFLTFLNGFTDILVDIQPLYDENGQPAYKKDTMDNLIGLGGNSMIEDLSSYGTLLDENGNPWHPPKVGSAYYDPDTGSTKLIGWDNIEDSFQSLDDQVEEQNYVPFRLPAQQWEFKEVGQGNNKSYKMYPVYKEISTNYNTSTQYAYCAFDIKWNAYPGEDLNGDPISPRLEKYMRCEKNLWPTMPRVLPLGYYCLYDKVAGKPACMNNNGQAVACAGSANSCIKHNDPSHPTLVPTRLMDSGNTVTDCDPIEWWKCRKPFQGILGKIDAIFNSVLGDDSSKNMGTLAIALAAWGVGGGFFLSLLLMAGIGTLFVFTIQLMWTFVTSVMCLTFLLMLSPIFISCALFKISEKFFKGWFAALISYTMQPFLIMAIIFFLSHIISLDEITKLARNEIVSKPYIMNIGGEGSGTNVSFNNTGFAEALYEKPADFDNFFYNNATKDIVDPTTGKPPIYITYEQRQIYLERKGGDYILSSFLFAMTNDPGGSHTKDITTSHTFLDANFLDSQQYTGDINKLTKLWYYGMFPEYANPLSNGKKQTDKRGIEAIQDLLSVNANMNNNPQYKELMGCYQFGCEKNGIKIQGINPGTIDNNWNLTNDEKYFASPDDEDSFLGEPKSELNNNKGPKYAEFPKCIKYCPQFNPAYDPSKTDLSNPNVNPKVQPFFPDGTTCTEGILIATKCAPNAECTKYCMFINKSLEGNYTRLFKDILIWILINATAAAFISKVPEIAYSLSNWQNYAPKGMIMGGASRKTDDGAPWTTGSSLTDKERSGMYHVGGIFDTGLLSGNAGAVPAGIDKLMRELSGPKYEVDPTTGILKEVPRQPYWKFQGALFQRQKDPMVEFAKNFNKALYNKEAGGNTADVVLAADPNGVFKGMNRNDLWKIAKDLVTDPKKHNLSYSATEDQIRRAIEKILLEEKSKSSGPNR